MASAAAVAGNVNHAIPHKPVPAPKTGSLKKANAATGIRSPRPSFNWEVWGPAFLVLAVNLLALIATAAFAMGVFSERMNGVLTDVSTLQTTTEAIRQEVQSLEVNLGRVDERLENLQRSADKQAAAVEKLNHTIMSIAADIK